MSDRQLPHWRVATSGAAAAIAVGWAILVIGIALGADEGGPL